MAWLDPKTRLAAADVLRGEVRRLKAKARSVSPQVAAPYWIQARDFEQLADQIETGLSDPD